MTAFDYCGEPGLVWYSMVEHKRGDELQIGDWLDTLDHRGARMIYAVAIKDRDGDRRYVGFSVWHYNLDVEDPGSDWEAVRDDVLYDVVDPDSICDPMGDTF
jgi:hypothetical protein